MPVSAPMARAAMGVTNPAAGVMPTSPATAPEMAPSAVGLPFFSHSATDQPMAAAAAVAGHFVDIREV